tara:strand:- start:2707 stop:3015 length:309 start_codon:yes stop_codon:yes gene_type:complete
MFIISNDRLKDYSTFYNSNIYVDYNAGYIYQILKQEELDKIENTYNLFETNKDLFLITSIYIFSVFLVILFPIIKKFFNNSYNTLIFTTQICKFIYIVKLLI